MRAEDYSEREIEVDGWPVRLTTYRISETWHCKADNVSPGAALARISAASREEAESRAVERARKHLSRTRVHPI